MRPLNLTLFLFLLLQTRGVFAQEELRLAGTISPVVSSPESSTPPARVSPAVTPPALTPFAPLPVAGPSDDVPSLEELLATEQGLEVVDGIEIRPVDPGWWQPMVHAPLRQTSQVTPVPLHGVLMSTLRHSQQLQVFSQLPLIRETSVVEADAAFDWTQFLTSRWDDTSDPVGNSLTAGPGINRFNDHNLTYSGGVRKQLRTGGQLDLSQHFGIQENNSEFFVPNNQGTSRLILTYTHPLMRGRGRYYNESLICLARLDKTIADDELQRQLQSHLLEVTRSYWALYLERAVLLQKMRSYLRARQTVGTLELRRDIDAAQSQIVSAQAALKSRRSDLLRAKMAVQNAEARLRSQVNDPVYSDFETTEIIPSDAPLFSTMPVDMHQALAEAVRHRPEVSQSIKQIRAASIRLDMTKNELMPVLNLVTETYVSGLAGERDINRAFANQFSVGAPSYSVGLQFEVPINNRAARAIIGGSTNCGSCRASTKRHWQRSGSKWKLQFANC